MRSRILCVLLGLAMGWTVTGAPADASYAPKVKEQSRQRPIPTPGRRIGLLKKGSTCPSVPGWRRESLFELAVAHAEDRTPRPHYQYVTPSSPKETLIDKRRQAKAEALFRKHDLNRFCVYTNQDKRQAFRTPAGMSKIEPDQLALTPSAPFDLDPLGDQIWEPLAEHFLDQVGRAHLDSAQNPVRLVFVDTHPTGEGLPVKSSALKSLHGYGMAHLGYELVCGHGMSQSCPIQIATRLALRHNGFNLDLPDDPGSDNGGHQGRIGDLAIAILAEIEHWKTLQPQPKLILNLSIGWDSEYNDPDATKKEKLDAATQAVYNALDYARDLGVLVIAAAGNRSGGQNSQWPLLPAAWEARSPSWLPSLLGRKVAYAVGGVDWQGLPLPNARPGGMPWRVAYADHAVTKTASGGIGGLEPTKIYTGSSVSAVVASSTAAVVWHLSPGLTPAQVMELMDDAADPLPSTATFYSSSWWTNGPPPLKRLSLCKTLLKLCVNGGPCLAEGSLYCPQKYAPADFSGITPYSASPVTLNSAGSPTCDPQTQVYLKAEHLNFEPEGCPMELLPDMSSPSLVQVLPPETPCPNCSVVPDRPAVVVASLVPMLGELPSEAKIYNLAAAIDSDWLALANQTTIESAILVVDCKTDSPIKERLDLTSQFSTLLTAMQGPTPPDEPIRISFGPIGQRTSIKGCTASVDFKLKVLIDGVATERSVQSAVYVDP